MHRTPQPPARFAVSLHPDIFYALQVLSSPAAGTHGRWRKKALRRFPRSSWPIQLPGALWTAVPDILDLGPAPEIDVLVQSLAQVPDRTLQVRFLTGLFHHESAAMAVLDEGVAIERIAASLPRAKREWLAHVGLYPIEPEVEHALQLVVRAPQKFRADVVATVEAFWQAAFSETWAELLPALRASVEEKQRLFDRSTFRDFLRHTLLPVELAGPRKTLRALRGGYELPLSRVKECIFTPSAFNSNRFWTTLGTDDEPSPWFPYLEPGLEPGSGDISTKGSDPPPDVALIFRALGDATRFAMMSLIGRCPCSAAELASMLSVSKPTISHHLHLLRAAGLVHETDHKDSNLISVNRGILEQISDLTVARLLESRQPLEITRSRRA